MTEEILKHFEEKFTNLPEGTVLVPSTDDDDSDVADVEFNEPTLMRPKYPAQQWKRLCLANGWTGMDCESTQLRGEELVEDGIQHALEKREEL